MTPDLRACLDALFTPELIANCAYMDARFTYGEIAQRFAAALLPTLEAREQALRAELTAANVAYARLGAKHVMMVGEEHEARLAAESALADLRAQVRALRSRLWMAIGRLDADPAVVAAYKVIIDQIDALLGDAPAPVATTPKE